MRNSQIASEISSDALVSRLSAVLLKQFPNGDQRETSLRIALYVFVPLVAGLLLGWQRPGRTVGAELPVALLYWSVLCIGSWWTVSLVCMISAHWLRRFGFWTTAIGGWFLALPISYLVGAGLANVLIVLFPQLGSTFPAPVFALSFQESWQGILEEGFPGLIVWLAAHSLFHIGFGLPMFGIRRGLSLAPMTEPKEPAVFVPPFMTKMPEHARGEVISVRAELHYIRVCYRAR